MPLYEYRCLRCGATFEMLQKVQDGPPEKCPSCGGPVTKLVSQPAIQFKGNGWYVTDYAKKPSGETEKKPGAEKDAAGPSGAPDKPKPPVPSSD